MSYYSTVQTRLVDVRYLCMALADMGLKQVEVHETPQTLDGYFGGVEGQRAEVIIRKENLGNATADLGFRRGPDGTFSAVLDPEYGGSYHDPGWLGRLSQLYAYHVAREQLEEQGFDLVEEEKAEDLSIRLTMRRMC